MSRTADNQIERVEQLARETGADEDILFDAYSACMSVGEIFDDFEKRVRRCADLSKETKYNVSFLVQTYAANAACGNDFEHFEEVTKEEDW